MESQVIWLSGSTENVSDRLRIVGAGYRDQMVPCMVDRPRGTDDYLFLHFHTPVRVWHEGQLRDYAAHTFFLWEPGHRHTFGNPTRNWSHSWLHCDGEAVRKALYEPRGSVTLAPQRERADVNEANAGRGVPREGIGTTPSPRTRSRSSRPSPALGGGQLLGARVPLNQPLRFPDALLVERNLKQIYDELRANVYPDATILECRIAIWLRELERETAVKRPPARMPERTLQSIRYMETHLAEPIALADLAAQASLSISRFSQEFRENLGTSPIDYLLNLRLQQAAHHLRNRNLSVAEVAEKVGFNDAFYFSRQFRRCHGCSPMQYRQKILGHR